VRRRYYDVQRYGQKRRHGTWRRMRMSSVWIYSTASGRYPMQYNEMPEMWNTVSKKVIKWRI